MNNLQLLRDKIKDFECSRIKVAVVFGGDFPESDVSKETAKCIEKALHHLNIKHLMVNCDHDVLENIKNYNPDIVLNAMHGKFGEDGGLVSMLDFFKIKYTHSGYYPSFMGMQKDLIHNICGINEIPSPKWIKVKKYQITKQNIDGYFEKLACNKIVIKPNDDGSSICVVILERGEEYNLAEISASTSIDFLVQEYIEGVEISTPVFFGDAIGSLELQPKNGFYDYKNKYTYNATDHFYPARIPDNLYRKTLEYAERMHKFLGCSGVSRSDFRIDITNNSVYFLEINTHPGMTELSIVPDVAKNNGINFNELVLLMIYDAYCRKL